MDTPRRWQVASLATAVTSIGIGGLLLSRPSVEPVAPIVLESRAAPDVAVVPFDHAGSSDVDGVPSIVGVDVVTPQTPVSLTSIGTPDEATSPSPSPTATSTQGASPAPAPAPTTTSSSQAGSLPSVSSADSLDSD